MASVFEHTDGRVMVDEGVAGGAGGGFVHRFHRLATEAEAAAFRLLHRVEEIATHEPVTDTAPDDSAA